MRLADSSQSSVYEFTPCKTRSALTAKRLFELFAQPEHTDRQDTVGDCQRQRSSERLPMRLQRPLVKTRQRLIKQTGWYWLLLADSLLMRLLFAGLLRRNVALTSPA